MQTFPLSGLLSGTFNGSRISLFYGRRESGYLGPKCLRLEPLLARLYWFFSSCCLTYIPVFILSLELGNLGLLAANLHVLLSCNVGKEADLALGRCQSLLSELQE